MMDLQPAYGLSHLLHDDPRRYAPTQLWMKKQVKKMDEWITMDG